MVCIEQKSLATTVAHISDTYLMMDPKPYQTANPQLASGTVSILLPLISALKTSSVGSGMAKPENKIKVPIKVPRSPVPMTFRILTVQTATVFFILFALFFFVGIIGIGWIIALIVIVLAALTNIALSLLFYFDWKSRTYEIRQEGIVETRGIIARREDTYPCHNIESITMKQDLMARYFNYGTIQLYDPALKQTVYLVNIKEPEKIHNFLTKIFVLDDKPAESQFIIQ
jgi:membrane protein YdbS with pleckstrin-like domain